MKRVIGRAAALGLTGAVAVLLAACPAPEEEPTWEPFEPAEPVEEWVRAYEAALEEVGGSGVTGTAVVRVHEDDRIEVEVMAHGVDPDARVAQHVHMGPGCDQPGGILLNLDDRISHANEAAPRGDHYPTAGDDGMLEYEESRSLSELREAMGEAELDLENRVVQLHGEDMRPIACGPLQAHAPTAPAAPTAP